MLFRLHGNLPQATRQHTIKAFSTSSRAVLFATDVAARGLDLPVVQLIVQMDPPSETTEYVHRVGRTARLGKSGSAVLFISPH